MNKNTFLILGLLTTLSIGCVSNELKEQADQQFGDQRFKTAISLIELYKIREGQYPPSLDSLKYLGEWDKMIYGSVEYKRLDDGYELNLTNGWMEKPEGLKYPDDFWKGLGIRRSNLR